MDLHNNAEGIAIGQSVRLLFPNPPAHPADPAILDAIGQRIMAKLMAGDLYIVDPATLMVIKSNGKPIH
jgi:hypothetical protein